MSGHLLNRKHNRKKSKQKQVKTVRNVMRQNEIDVKYDEKEDLNELNDGIYECPKCKKSLPLKQWIKSANSYYICAVARCDFKGCVKCGIDKLIHDGLNCISSQTIYNHSKNWAKCDCGVLVQNKSIFAISYSPLFQHKDCK
eukprot:713138_1